MSRPAKVVVTKERSVHTYAELWRASHSVLMVGIEEPTGSSWQFLSSIVLTTFTFEAYLNHIGPRIFDCWSQLDRLPPWSKFELLCEKLGVKYEGGPGVRPLQTTTKLLDFRNTIAHGRSVELKSKPTILNADDQLDGRLGDRLRTNWENLIQTKDFAERARVDVEAVLVSLHEARQDGKKGHLFASGTGHHFARAIKKP